MVGARPLRRHPFLGCRSCEKSGAPQPLEKEPPWSRRRKRPWQSGQDASLRWCFRSARAIRATESGSASPDAALWKAKKGHRQAHRQVWVVLTSRPTKDAWGDDTRDLNQCQAPVFITPLWPACGYETSPVTPKRHVLRAVSSRIPQASEKTPHFAG